MSGLRNVKPDKNQKPPKRQFQSTLPTLITQRPTMEEETALNNRRKNKHLRMEKDKKPEGKTRWQLQDRPNPTSMSDREDHRATNNPRRETKDS
jgi:hypothetical protein